MRTNPWSELKRKNQILTSICQLVTKIAGDTVNESNVINVLEQFIADPNQSMRHMSRVWGEVAFFSMIFCSNLLQTEDRIDTLKNKSQVERVQLELELIKEREKARNLQSILIQKELESKCDQLEKRNLRLMAKVKSLKEHKSRTNQGVQTINESI